MTCVLSHTALRYLSIAALTATACGIVTGCSDDTPDVQPGESGSEIRFKVTATGVASWHSRGGGEQAGVTLPSVTVSSAGGMTLYLHPAVTETALASPSRGTTVDSESISTFGVFAAYNPSSLDLSDMSPDYMYNVEVTRANDWTPVSNYLWPGSGKLHFTAYSPFAESAAADEGIIALPLRSDSGHLKLGYKVPADVDAQTDLLVSTPKDANSSPCDLDFSHALTAIMFATGDRMAPCKVTKIEITGIADSGTLDMETGSWSNVSGNASYSVSPDVELTAADGSEYATPDTPITPVDRPFLLMPQTLGGDASLAITLETDGSTTRLEGSLAGGVWEPGKTIVYNLSANPESDKLILNVDGNFSTTYLGGTMDFTVTSQYQSKGTLTDVNWKAEFVDDNGNVIDRPQWIVDFPMSGTGVSESKAMTRIQDFTFDVISPESQILQDAADINATSGYTPYNLASSTGSPAVENTANSYIINSPGIYSIPLVYGNAIKNGAVNTSAYTASSQLRTFVNHTGNGITDPYIYNNSGCVPADAVLVWEDHLNLIRDVRLSDDAKSITLDIPHSSIRQGNALIAVRDAAGTVMWSWHIWVTDYNPASEQRVISDGTTTVSMFARDMGRIIGDDVTNFPDCKVKVRFTQTDVPEGKQPLSRTVDLEQTGIILRTGDSFTLYQWGRKDPIIGHENRWYDASHQVHENILTEDCNTMPTGTELLDDFIKSPQVMWTADHTHTFSYTNMWNSGRSTTSSIKTVYDPSPVGYKVPVGTVLNHIANDASATITHLATAEGNRKAGFYITQADGNVIYFPDLGYRAGRDGSEQSYGISGEWWICTGNRTEARAIVLSVDTGGSVTKRTTTEPRTHALGVIPEKEE